MSRPSKVLRSVTLALAAALVAGPIAAASVEVEVSIAFMAGRPEVLPKSLIVVGEPEVGEPVTWEIDSPSALIPLDNRWGWYLWAEAPELWGEEVWLDRPTADRTVRLRLFPVGVLEGGLKSDSALPASLDAYFDSGDRETSAVVPESGYADCPIEDGRFLCDLPAGVFDVELSSGFFVPARVRSVAIEAGAETDVGGLELELGGGVTGRVELDDGGAPSADCVVSLGSPNRATRSEGETGLERTSCEDGWFEFNGVPAGPWRAAADQPEYVSDESAPFVVEAGISLEVADSLRLSKPARLELVFNPQLDPIGQQWRFTLAQLENGQPGKPVEGVAKPDGTWTGDEMATGTYRVELSEVDPSWFSRDVRLERGGSLELLEPEIVALEGWVTLGREPLQAHIEFGAGSKEVVDFDSDDVGYFTGLLPRPGFWKVGVAARAEGVSIEIPDIEVMDNGGGRASVQLELPGTELEGWVRNPQGEPVRGATIRVRSRSTRAIRKILTDADGHFHVRGLPAELVSVRAEAPGSRPTSWFEVSLESGSTAAPLQLVMQRRGR